jgi:hypothetical protein
MINFKYASDTHPHKNVFPEEETQVMTLSFSKKLIFEDESTTLAKLPPIPYLCIT